MLISEAYQNYPVGSQLLRSVTRFTYWNLGIKASFSRWVERKNAVLGHCIRAKST